VDPEPAGWWRRAAAFILDALVTLALGLAIDAPLGISRFNGHVAADQQTLALAIGAVVAAIYYSLVMTRTNGRTVGKYALRLRVITMSDEPIGVPVVLLREVVAKQLAWGLVLVDTVVIFGPAELVLLVNYLWPLWESRNRALHDLFAGTRVIRETASG
jgi:uncharacterized RDD family membrane protein YckC